MRRGRAGGRGRRGAGRGETPRPRGPGGPPERGDLGDRGAGDGEGVLSQGSAEGSGGGDWKKRFGTLTEPETGSQEDSGTSN